MSKSTILHRGRASLCALGEYLRRRCFLRRGASRSRFPRKRSGIGRLIRGSMPGSASSEVLTLLHISMPLVGKSDRVGPHNCPIPLFPSRQHWAP